MDTKLKRFPIGIQDFRTLREEGYYYVDKTDLVYEMTHSDRYYFMSRPRRFGKSLLISTLKEYFEGSKELFTGLAIEKLETEWKKYPVFHMSFAINKYIVEQDFADTMLRQLRIWEKKYGLEVKDTHAWGPRFADILTAAYEQTGIKPVILVDEYDAPLLDSLDNPDLQLFFKNEMRKFFSPLKDLGSIIRFVFLTGISKFSQLSIFSELNNLKVITMSDKYASLCGITEEELKTQFKPEIEALGKKQGLTYEQALAALKHKYDGYHFSENSPDIYNPFSLINSLSDKKLDNYWFSTGTPAILTKLISKYNLEAEDFDKGVRASVEMFDMPAERAEDAIPMLYQSGYLTIKSCRNSVYTLGFPNEEVSIGFMKSLVPYYANASVSKNESFIIEFTDAMEQHKIDEALTLMKSFFASIPYNAERQDENHYKTAFYLIFRIATVYVVNTEVCTSAGRIDAVVETEDSVYVFEFKLEGTVQEALAQIDSKGYLIPYEVTKDKNGNLKTLYKIGVNFDKATRTIGEWKIK